jgi:hypothetical protein
MLSEQRKAEQAARSQTSQPQLQTQAEPPPQPQVVQQPLPVPQPQRQTALSDQPPQPQTTPQTTDVVEIDPQLYAQVFGSSQKEKKKIQGLLRMYFQELKKAGVRLFPAKLVFVCAELYQDKSEESWRHSCDGIHQRKSERTTDEL